MDQEIGKSMQLIYKVAVNLNYKQPDISAIMIKISKILNHRKLYGKTILFGFKISL